MEPTEILKNFTGILSIVNPIGAIPIFIGLTSDWTQKQRNRTANITALSTSIILLISAFLGNYVLKFFGIRLSSFQVGGGILLLLIAISMLHAKVSHAKHTPQEAQEAEDMESIGVVPLSMPLLAGPGSISTVILYAHYAQKLHEKVILAGIIISVGALVWLSLRMAVPIGSRLGATGINIAVRILGLILAAISVEFMAAGLKSLFPVLR